MDSLSKEQQILVVMRKVLTSIIRDTTPPPGLQHPLSAQTIEDMRQCLALIAARERELAEQRGAVQERPYYADEPASATVVPIGRISKANKDLDD
jgi:hypothetical protein